MDRRSFIQLLTTAAAAIGIEYTVGNELTEALVQEAARESGLTTSEIIARELELVRPMIVQLFEQQDSFFKAITKGPVEVTGMRDMRVPLQIKPKSRLR